MLNPEQKIQGWMNFTPEELAPEVMRLQGEALRLTNEARLIQEAIHRIIGAQHYETND